MMIFLNRLKKKKGFSLVECVMAIALFSIMAMMVLRILSIAVERNNTNKELVRAQEYQLSLIASGEVYNVGNESNSDPLFVQKFSSSGGPAEIGAYYASYTAKGADFFISKPNYNLSLYEEELIKKFMNHDTDSSEYNVMTGASFYSGMVLSSGTIKIELTTPDAQKVMYEPVNVDGVTYEEYHEYKMEFGAAQSDGNYITTIKLPKAEDGILLNFSSTNASVRMLQMTSTELPIETNNYLRITNIGDGLTEIRLAFYYKSGKSFTANSDFGGSPANLARVEPSNVYKRE